ncbi:uncharacterized protein N7459_003077 [Penicillium hispanicum]|uniref:uncharacterized protein n=1 Tax=Penicillium hispanicum TaxID=1080232 RepID=UPI002541C206|nr:uncharacterized protein N7459_003077 [Penicillium hispanicum]KAJ5587312.1 hypothetical protein N7459_003077 [Penicillium hispanicum]
MHALWSRAASSQLTCHCVSRLSTTANGITSRSAAAASKRRLRIGNSVTAFYTSIFAAAALADARAKTQRRHDWEEKIAAVKAEVNELMDEEQRIIESLKLRRKPRALSGFLQKRGFGTVPNLSLATSPRATPYQPTRSFYTERRLLNAATTKSQDTELEQHEIGISTAEDEGGELRAALHEPIPEWALNDHGRIKAIQKLALRQFAIRILLRPIIAHRYSGLQMNYMSDADIPDMNTDQLLRQLNEIRKRMRSLKQDPKARFKDLMKNYAGREIETLRTEGNTLDRELQENLAAFMRRDMTLQEVLLRISSNLLNSPDPDRTGAFRQILLAFITTRQNDLNELLLRTLLPNYFHLSPSLVVTILSFFRKTKNLKDFDLFLQMLAGKGWPVNLGVAEKYRRATINGVEVVVPPYDSNNPVIISELVACALRFDQPDRADAWLHGGRRVGFFDNFSTLSQYIRFYSIRQDWEKGISALKRATTFILSSTDHPPEMVERLIVIMAHFCDACRKPDVSAEIISAAMHCGFNPALPARQLDVAPIIDHKFTRWTRAAEQAPEENIDRPAWQKFLDFGAIFGERLSKFDVPLDSTRMQQLSYLAARHAHGALTSALADNVYRAETLRSDEGTHEKGSGPGAVASDKDSQAQSSSNELNSLKTEVAELRGLVSELRGIYIRASFKPNTGEFEIFRPKGPVSQSTADTSSESPLSPTGSMKVEFERTPDNHELTSTAVSDAPES